MVWELLRLVCLLLLGLLLALLAGGDDLQKQILSVARRNPDQLQMARFCIAGLGACCFAASGLSSRAKDSVQPPEAARDPTLALVAISLAILLGWVLHVVEEIALAKSARAKHSEQENHLAKLRQELEEAHREVEEWKEKSGKLETQVAAIRKQAEGQAAEYMRLMTENRCLQNQIDDFDLFTGATRKKAS
eukprot:TRINITY_DN17342_c0_g1_i2.p1 TRINITY_DN17342_c0_g1~~TRINITY_DN17342_c0_g1_i2.p1  ORF type:complete len:208 (-),score=54.09 TRINITY_DN17342_c0_g1_i2:13-585(-)